MHAVDDHPARLDMRISERFFERVDRRDAAVGVSEARLPVRQRMGAENGGELISHTRLDGRVAAAVQRLEIGTRYHIAQPLPELALERADGDEAFIGRAVQ